MIIIFILILIIFLEIVRETHTFKVTHYQIKSPKLSRRKTDLNIMFLSDLHNTVYGKSNEKLIKKIKEEAPDLILVGGDMLIGKRDIPYTTAEKFMIQLSMIAPVYCANGNHEQRMREKPQEYGFAYDKYRKTLTNNRIIMLENTSYVRDWDSELAMITGLEIPLFYYDTFNHCQLSVNEIEEKIGKSSMVYYQILLAHNPVHADTYVKGGADLVLSGHLHGGIIRIPFVGGIMSPQVKLFPRFSGGIYNVDHSTVVVSRGLGNHTIKLRLFNPAEVVMLHLNGK
ncbi:MAG: metallophosphoesterase [Lachnospiraceae bacterium]